MIYRIISKSNIIITDNSKKICYKCIQNSLSSNRTFKLKCPDSKRLCRNGHYSFEDSLIFLCSDSKKDVNSKRILKSKAFAFFSVLMNLKEIKQDENEKANDKTRRLLHNLTEINALNVQEIFNFIPQNILSENMNDQFEIIENKIKCNSFQASKLFLRLTKNNLAMKIEFRVFKILQDDYSKRLNFRLHQLNKVILNVMHPFFTDFTDEDVHINVESNTIKAYLDYETFSVAVFLIAENAKKYVAPHTTIDVEFKVVESDAHIVFDMISTKILDNEKDKLCDDGFCGEFPLKYGLSGNGIGMYRMRKLLAFNSAYICIINNVVANKSITENGFEYENNQFKIILKDYKKKNKKHILRN